MAHWFFYQPGKIFSRAFWFFNTPNPWQAVLKIICFRSWFCSNANHKSPGKPVFSHGTVFRSYYAGSFTIKNINMKQLTTRNGFRFFLTVLAMSFIQIIAYSQDSTSSGSSSTKTTTTTTTTWYTEPWVWVVGGVLLLLVIIALMRGNNPNTTERTTVIRNSSTEKEVWFC